MREQLKRLREAMARSGVDVYLIPTTDFHGSEYVNDYFKCRRFISGFTGSAGTLAVTQEEAWLWTDGRYFLQAENQLAGTGIGLMKMGEEGVPTIVEYLQQALSGGGVLGFDARVVDCATGRTLSRLGQIRCDLDLAGQIWTDRPPIKPGEIYSLPESVTGEPAASKLSRIYSYLQSKGADYHLITKLEDIAWLFNLRGSDIENTPVFFAFALLGKDFVNLYLMDETTSAAKSLAASIPQLKVLPYLQVFDDMGKLKAGSTILLDENLASYAFISALPETVSVINDRNPAELMKALKNRTEIDSTLKAHLRDGAAVVNFIYWLKHHIGRETITEISAADYLENCRRQQPGFKDLSFETISGYQENGAIIHYGPTPETDKTLRAEGFLLVDSGGQYEDGTTDITRTIALGPLTREMKEHYTAVLRCHIKLASAVFPEGTTGAQLDAVARGPLHQLGLDYNHGTGHGVGHLLSVHEGPQSISPRCTGVPLYPGMITSNEPGLYLENRYGIRLENEILCQQLPSGALGFVTITSCPFEREAILPELMTGEELDWLNHYHLQVYNNLAPLLTEETALWLKEATSPMEK